MYVESYEGKISLNFNTVFIIIYCNHMSNISNKSDCFFTMSPTHLPNYKSTNSLIKFQFLHWWYCAVFLYLYTMRALVYRWIGSIVGG